MSLGPSAVIIRPANSTPLNGVPRLAIAATVGSMISRMVRSIIAGVMTGGRRVGAHAAGVGAGVAVADALVILRGRQRQRVLAVDEGEEARLLAFEEFLDDDLAAGLAEGAGEAGVDRRLGLGARRGDGDALAGGETVGLDDDRQLLPGEVRLGGRGVLEASIGRGRNAELGAQILGEALRALELRRRLLRPEALDSRRREIIYQAGDERRLRPDDDEIDGVIRAEANDGSMVGDGKRDALGDLRNSAVPGRTIELR